MENGSQVPVTADNVDMYVSLMLRHYLFDRHRMQLGFLIKGFSEVVPPALVSVFTSAEFEALISGADRIDVDDWAASTQYRGKYMKNKEQHEVIDWWWTYVRSLTREDQARLLRFCTGSSRVPIMGFKSLQGDDGASMPFSIDSVSLATAVFPRAHTCFNRCVLFFWFCALGRLTPKQTQSRAAHVQNVRGPRASLQRGNCVPLRGLPHGRASRHYYVMF